MEIQAFLLFSLALGFATLAIVELKTGLPNSAATIEKCRAANGLEKGKWEKMYKEKKVPDDKKLWCMMACVSETYGVMLPGAKIDWNRALILNIILYGAEKGRKLVDICQSKIKEGPERCQLAKELFDCYFVEGKKIGAI